MEKRNIILLLLVGLAFYIMYNTNKDNSEDLEGGNIDEQTNSDSSELSDMESGDYAAIESDNDDNKEILELEKQKQELELENQKIQLKQLEKEKNNTIANNNSADNVNGLGLCNKQHNFAEKDNNHNLLNMDDCNSDYYTLPDEYLSSNKEKIKPNELLPSNSVDMKGENFLTATLSQSSEQVIGKPTQVHRSRKNWDLRSTPPNPQVEII